MSLNLKSSYHDLENSKLIFNSFFGYKAINRIEIIQQKMANKVSAPNNNNELDDEVNINSLDLEFLKIFFANFTFANRFEIIKPNDNPYIPKEYIPKTICESVSAIDL